MFEPQGPVHRRGKFLAMRDNDHSHTHGLVQREQQAQHALTGLGVKIAGRLICQHQTGLQDQGPRNRYPLLFSPDNSPGRWLRRADRPTRSNISAARVRASS